MVGITQILAVMKHPAQHFADQMRGLAIQYSVDFDMLQHAEGLSQRHAARRGQRGASDVLRVGLVLFDVAGVLPLVVHLVLLQVGLVDVVRGHAEGLRE